MSKRRKLRIFPVICLIAVIAVAFWAVTLVVGLIDNENSPEIVTDETITPVTPSDVPELPTDTENEENSETVAPETIVDELPEDKTVFSQEAPKPLYTQAQLLEMYPETVLGASEDAGQGYIDDTIFIGDSTTHGMAFYGVLNGGKETTQVWTPKSGTLAMWNLLSENIVYPDDDSEMLIGDAIAIKQPKRVVLTLGVNGVSSLSEKDFKAYYQGLIDVIKKQSGETQIILQSIYPVCDYYQYVNSISMEKINNANAWIAELANENGIYYLNTISVLINEKGYLTENYCNGDGIHISREGFNVILDYIRTHAID